MAIKIIITKKTKDKINLIFNNLCRDVSYRYGGWAWLFTKLLWNAVMMWIFFNFLWAFFFFVFKTNGITTEHIESIHDVFYIIGILWIVILGLSSSKER